MRVDIYDYEDKIIYNNIELHSALDVEDWQRAIHVVLYNENHEFLICQNASDVLYFEDKWDIGVSGSLQSGESPLDAGSRICNEQLAIYIEAQKLSPLMRHSEISIHQRAGQNSLQVVPQALKRHVQTFIYLVPSGLINKDYIDYNVFQSMAWETGYGLRKRIMENSDVFAYHPSHSLETLERLDYWGLVLEKIQRRVDEELSDYALHDLESLQKNYK